MAMVQSVIRRLVWLGRIHGRTSGYKWSLLKVREGKYKGKHDGQCGSRKLRERVFGLQVLLKPMITYGKGRARRFPANNQSLGGA
jgi:hypothetical protein